MEYSLRAIPLGGYVGFPDDDPDSPYDKDDPDLLRNRPVAQRALVISAGIIANVILAYSVLLAQVGMALFCDHQVTLGHIRSHSEGRHHPQCVATVDHSRGAASAGLPLPDLVFVSRVWMHKFELLHVLPCVPALQAMQSNHREELLQMHATPVSTPTLGDLLGVRRKRCSQAPTHVYSIVARLCCRSRQLGRPRWTSYLASWRHK